MRIQRTKPAVAMLTTQYAKALPEIRFSLATEDPSAGTGRFRDRYGPVAW